MNAESLPLWLALCTQLGLGLAVFRANPRNYANQSFLLASLFMSAWLLSLHFAFTATRAYEAEFWIRNASATGILIVNAFNLLRLGILCRDTGWLDIGKREAALAFLSISAIVLCYTNYFLRRAELRTGAIADQLIPEPVYGSLFPLYVGFLTSAILIVIASYVRDLRHHDGMQKVELQFAVTGAMTLAILVATTPFVQRAVVVRLAPFRLVVFSLIIAYGIATRKIMDVGTFLRRAISYGLLTLYLAIIYFGIWWASDHVLLGLGVHSAAPHVLGALAVALSMAPARGVSKNFADKLFVNSSGVDFQDTVSRAAAILSSVTTLRDLLQRFATTTADAVGTDRAVILLPDRNGFTQPYPGENDPSISLSPDHPLVAYLKEHREAIVLDELHRIRPTPELQLIITEMRRLKLAVVIGIFSRDKLAAVML